MCVWGGGKEFSESAGGYVSLPFRACSSKNKTVNPFPCIHIFWLSIDIEETNEVADERTEQVLLMLSTHRKLCKNGSEHLNLSTRQY